MKQPKQQYNKTDIQRLQILEILYTDYKIIVVILFKQIER